MKVVAGRNWPKEGEELQDYPEDVSRITEIRP
jgi:hypothetical protein